MTSDVDRAALVDAAIKAYESVIDATDSHAAIAAAVDAVLDVIEPPRRGAWTLGREGLIVFWRNG